MGQTQDSAGQVERAGDDFGPMQETYDAARAKLMDLIDNPEKHLPVSEYRAHLTAAQNAVDAAANDLMKAAWA